MHPQFSDTTAEKPIRTDPDGTVHMPEWSDDDLKKSQPKQQRQAKAKKREYVDEVGTKEVRKRTPRPLQPDATQYNSVTEAEEWLAAHPEEAAMLRRAQGKSKRDILTDAGVITRYYSSSETAAFFDKTVQWLYWGMRHPPNGGRLFVEPVLDDHGRQVVADGVPQIRDIPVERLGDPVTGKRRFDIATIRKFATSAYFMGNIKEPKLKAVLERLVVAEGGGNWKAIVIPTRQGDDDGPD